MRASAQEYMFSSEASNHRWVAGEVTRGRGGLSVRGASVVEPRMDGALPELAAGRGRSRLGLLLLVCEGSFLYCPNLPLLRPLHMYVC